MLLRIATAEYTVQILIKIGSVRYMLHLATVVTCQRACNDIDDTLALTAFLLLPLSCVMKLCRYAIGVTTTLPWIILMF